MAKRKGTVKGQIPPASEIPKPTEKTKVAEPIKNFKKEFAYTPSGKAKVLFVEANIVTVEFADKSKKTFKESEIEYCE